ncbi:MAG: GNAT family N-acetyltransferase [Pseudomonadota bacterium]
MGGRDRGRLIGYDPRFRTAFAALNYEWIERYFAVEQEDRLALEDPEGYALNKGGEIFFVVEDDTAVGTVAMVPDKESNDPGVWELAKMAVRPDRQGYGYSRLLMDACVDFARARNAKEIMLVTNDVLTPALGLYTSSGFVAQPQMTDQRYSRGNLQMRLRL